MPDSDVSADSVVAEPTIADPADFELGRQALLEITSADSVGEPAGSISLGEGVVTVYFETNLAGYPGWRWTVSIAHVDGQPPSALETELTPGDTALLSPAWIPWVDRLAEYRASQDAAEGDSVTEDDDELDDDELDSDESDEDDEGEDEDDEDDDDSEDDPDEDDLLGSDTLHGGDLDGVDIDDLDESDDEDDPEDDSDEDEPEQP